MNGRFVPLGPRQIPVEEALGLGPAGIREQIKLRSDAVAGMLGWLTPSIVQDEIDRLEDELRRRGEEPDHVDVPTTPGMISAQHLAKLVMRHLADAKGEEGAPDPASPSGGESV